METYIVGSPDCNQVVLDEMTTAEGTLLDWNCWVRDMSLAKIPFDQVPKAARAEGEAVTRDEIKAAIAACKAYYDNKIINFRERALEIIARRYRKSPPWPSGSPA